MINLHQLVWKVMTKNIFAGRPARSAAMPVLFLLSGPKIGFSPAGATHCPDKRESTRLQVAFKFLV